MQQNEKILYFITKSNWGGAQKYVFDLSKNLKNDFDIVVAFGGNGILSEKLKNESIGTLSISYLERDIKIWNEPKAILEIYKIIKNEKPSIIHLNSPKAVLLGSIAGRLYNLFNKNNIKIIQTVHGLPFIEQRTFLWKTMMWFFSYLSIMLIQKNIFVSKKDIEYLRSMPFTKNKSFYIPNGIAPIYFIDKEIAREKLLGKKYDGILIGTIAEMNRNKGLEFLIHALSDLKNENLKAVLIGDGEKINELEKLKTEKVVDIEFAGLIPNASEYLKAFDIFILPSLKEGLPYVLLEAGMAGLPIISTTVGGIPYLIESEVDGILVPPKNSQELTNAIKRYLSDAELALKYSENFKNKVFNNYTLENTIKKTLEIYNS